MSSAALIPIDLAEFLDPFACPLLGLIALSIIGDNDPVKYSKRALRQRPRPVVQSFETWHIYDFYIYNFTAKLGLILKSRRV